MLVHRRAEMEHLEPPPATSDAGFAREDRTGAVQPDRDGNDDHQGQRERQQDTGNHRVRKAAYLIGSALGGAERGQGSTPTTRITDGCGIKLLLTSRVLLAQNIQRNGLQFYYI